MKLYDLSFHSSSHKLVTLDYLVNYLRQWGVSIPPTLVMIIDSLELNHWVASDNLYIIVRVS